MKKYISYLTIVVFSMILASCKKDSFNYPEGKVGISKITNYAVFQLKGTTTVNNVNYTIVPKGSTYTEPGASATEASKDIPLTTSGSVDTSTPGVYVITYAATNKDGFDASATRYVVVYSTDVTAAANDFSGKYARNTNGELAIWTKLAPGVYSVLNPGGAVGASLTVVAFNDTAYHFFIPDQLASDGTETSSALEQSTPGATPGTISQFKWKIINPGYGTSVRTFNIQ